MLTIEHIYIFFITSISFFAFPLSSSFSIFYCIILFKIRYLMYEVTDFNLFCNFLASDYTLMSN